jgi:hypothetical protein
VSRSGVTATISWNTAPGSTSSDVLRGALSGLPVGPGGGDETCLGPNGTSPATDLDVPSIGTGFWYLIRGTNACGQGDVRIPSGGRRADDGAGQHDLSVGVSFDRETCGPSTSCGGPQRLPCSFLLAALTFALACGRADPPSVLLVTIDTWRWDHVGASGRGKVATPHLDRLAAEGTYLARVQTTCPLTTPAHATILTGLTPRAHGIHDNQHFVLAPSAVTLAERFQRAAYDTGAFVSGAPLRRAYGLDRGFGTYDDQGLALEALDRSAPPSRRAGETTARALAWLGSRAPGRPSFLWVHYYDPHEPYGEKGTVPFLGTPGRSNTWTTGSARCSRRFPAIAGGSSR